MTKGETVLVTAAAGGTGQFAVQLAKLAGNKVVATCGGADKAALLKDLGVDRVIDYKKENVKEVLKKEYPKGVNIIYESVGGEMFDTCMNALAMFGRMVVIGMMSQYTEGEGGNWKPANYPRLCEKLLWKSQTVVSTCSVAMMYLKIELKRRQIHGFNSCGGWNDLGYAVWFLPRALRADVSAAHRQALRFVQFG